MDNKELEKLLNEIPISLDLEGSFEQGVRKFQKSIRTRNLVMPMMIAAVLFISFIGAIRLSSNVAMAVSQIPFLKPLVEMIHYDKGIKDVIDNEYYEEVNVSSTMDGFTLTVTSVVADEYGMIISYQLESEKNLLDYNTFPSLKQNGKRMMGSSISMDYPLEGDNHLFENKVEVVNSQGMNYDSYNFELSLELADNYFISVPFTLKKEIKQSKKVAINEVITVDGQKIEVKELIISPLRSMLVLQVDPNNSKQILSIQNIRIIDNKGNEWGTIRNGFSGSGDIRTEEYRVMLQSNYFQTPKSFTIHFSQIEFVEKGLEVIVDMEKLAVIKNTSDLDIQVIDSNTISYQVEKNEITNQVELFWDAEDANNNKFYFHSSDYDLLEDKVNMRQMLYLDKEPVQPLKLHFMKSYKYLDGVAQIKVKVKKQSN